MPGRWFSSAVAAAMLAALVPGAIAQTPVPKTIRLVVPFSAGGSNDVAARALAPTLSAKLGTTVIVENKPGAAGVIGADFVAKAPKDGSVLLLTSSSFLTAAATQPTLPYDPLAAFVPVAMIGRGPMLLVTSATTAFRSPADLVAAAKAAPGTINYGTAGIGSIAHLSTELFSDAAGVKMTHVPYKGASNAALELASGQIQVMISNYSTVASLLKAGKLRSLGVTTAREHAAFSGMPPLAGVAPGFDIDIWVAVFAPAGTPSDLVDRLNREVSAIAASPDMAVVLEPDGALPEAVSSAEFAARMKVELGKWKQIASTHRIVAQ